MLVMESGPDQSNELSLLDSDDGSISLDSLEDLEGLTVQLEYFNHFGACITLSHTSKV